MVTRWREERDHGRDNHDAVVVAMQTAGHAVVFSGVTVAIGLLALIVLPVPFMRSMGYGGALIPLASVLTTLTLTPAILGGIGPRVDWPKLRHENRASRAWSRWARAASCGAAGSRRGAAFAALGVLVAALFGVKIGLASSGSLAKSGPAYDALQTLKDGGVSTGVLTPIEVLVETDDADVDRDGVGARSTASRTRSSRPDRAATATARRSSCCSPANETVNSKTRRRRQAGEGRRERACPASSASPVSVRRRSTSCTRSTATSR